MASAFIAKKEVSALPAQGDLQKSTVYFVRVGTGFDLYLTNDLGTVVAYKLNEPSYADIAGRPPMGLSVWRAGAPTASEYMGGGIAPYSFSINANNSVARASAAATATSTFTINKVNASTGALTQIGTITFSSGGRLGVISITSAAVAAGDTLAIVAPSTIDSALVNLAFLLRE